MTAVRPLAKKCAEFYGQFDLVYVPVDFKFCASYGFAFRQLPEQSNSEDVSLSMPIVHARMSALSLPTERVSPGA